MSLRIRPTDFCMASDVYGVYSTDIYNTVELLPQVYHPCRIEIFCIAELYTERHNRIDHFAIKYSLLAAISDYFAHARPEVSCRQILRFRKNI